MNTGLLADHSAFIDELAASYENEWAPYYGESGPGDAVADLASRCNRDRLPIGLVAIEGNRILGSVALPARTAAAPEKTALPDNDCVGRCIAQYASSAVEPYSTLEASVSSPDIAALLPAVARGAWEG